MRKWMGLAPTVILASLGTIAAAQQPPAAQPQQAPKEWVDPATGHRIIRLSNIPGSSSSYFTQNEFTPDGKNLIITTPNGISAINLETHAIQPVVEGRAFMIAVGRKTGQVYYMKQGAVYATDVDTRTTRQIVKLPFFGGVASINADETLLAGSHVVGQTGPPSGGFPPRPPAPAPGTTQHQAIESNLHRRWAMHLPMALFTVDIKTGAVKEIYHSNDWLNHVQFSPTDPGLMMFCHEGPWELNDRIWTIRADGTQLTKIHTRTMKMEIFGHESWGEDGKTIWYDLQTPRGEDFWLAGYTIATGERTWYHLQRNEWSVHFKASPDGKLFAGDGGDEQMVANAKDGKWIYLFHPELLPNRGNDQPEFVQPGVFHSERLVNMSNHNYRLEPNVQFTPDGKWLVFRSNMSGATQVYEVEVSKSK
ncbi:MAG: oligogalacturonate lyase family protein [Terriglobia bacterium]